MDIEEITSIPLSTRRLEDCSAWHFEKKGIFSVRSAYRMIQNTKRVREAWLEERASSSYHKREEGASTSLWKIKVPSKIRAFLWRLAKQSIPTGDVRHRSNMAPDISCSNCGQADSWRHSLLECNMARSVWALAPDDITEHMERTTEPDAKQRLFTMIASLRHEELIGYLVTVWAIWYARRKVIPKTYSKAHYQHIYSWRVLYGSWRLWTRRSERPHPGDLKLHLRSGWRQ
jgi:hypothetical protein